MGQFTDLIRSAWRDYVVDGVPSSGDNKPSKPEIRTLGPLLDDAFADVEAMVGASIRGYRLIADLPVLTAGDAGTLARVEEDGNVYLWDGDSWGIFDDPIVQAAAEAEAARLAAVAAQTAAEEAAEEVVEIVRPSSTPIAGAFTDKDGRSPFVVLDDELGTILNPWLDAKFADVEPTPQGQRVLLFGDSRVDFCSDNRLTNTVGWLYWLQLLTGARFSFDPDSNYGKGGDDTGEARSRLPEVIADLAKLVIFLLGVNDRQGGMTFEQSVANLEPIFDGLRAAGKRVIVIAECPWGDAAHPSLILPPDQVAYHLRLREWYLARHDPPWVYVCDPFGDLVDPSSASAIALPGMMKDGGHLAAEGNLLVARRLAPIIENLFPPRPRLPASNADIFSADNPNGALTANPMTLGTGGALAAGVTGALADGWSASAAPAGLAVVLSKETVDGVEWQRVDISGTASGASVVALNQTIDVADLDAGDVLEAVALIEVTDSTGIRGVPVRLLATYPTLDSVNASAGHAASTDSIAPAAPWGGVALAPTMEISAVEDPSGVTLSVLAYMVQGAPTTASYRFRATAARKVF